jgi:UDP-3-O-[3-hydroxymyristoyl] N-acetylglucosamine deacetylase/3-hydroxyacyl-[acyl-carrier-protein] dehydratase
MKTMKQRTLKESFSLSGKGLHGGLQTTITFHPAPVNFGYKIKRSDLDGTPIIVASAENVKHSQRCTLLSVDGVEVATIEHALAALYGCEIDNCLIEIDSPEFPILDGSSIEYVKQIERVGCEEQSEDRIYYEVLQEVEYIDKETGSYLKLLPADDFKVDVKIDFDSAVLPEQHASLKHLSEFTTEFSMCRTFVFIKEIEQLLKFGLIKGGDLDNAIVINDQIIDQQEINRLADVMGIKPKNIDKMGYVMNKPLVFPNEPARHKLLDVIGDVALAGRFIKGHIIASRPGHRVNNMFARLVVEQMKSNALIEMQKKKIVA